VRRAFYPEEGPPIWNGAVLWRATTEAEPFLGGRSMVMAGHQAQKFVCYPISRELAQRGRSLVNWIAELRFDPSGGWRREDWNRPGRVEDFLPRFEAWTFGWLDAPSLIRGATAVYEYPMVDRDPVERWSFGRVTLLGDAAHPMYPIGSNGASQAILDARVLAHRLATSGDPVEALAAYDAERRPGTARIVLANRANGPERVMQAVEERAPEGFARLEDVISREELETAAGDYKMIAGFDKNLLNERPSLSVARAAPLSGS
jgi:2-polyprenyl-6-methoxyphenol hydroxylase-like FAD-dependent oxidoreductase